MQIKVKEYLAQLEFGEILQHQQYAVLPIFTSMESDIIYLTSEEAISEGILIITEVSAAGSVPELKVVNKAVLPVLLLDGEELVGAKQNRVLNTSILLKEKSETTIPVSCCEQGRWSYSSKNFSTSRDVIPARMRLGKLKMVNDSLQTMNRYDTRQGEIWNDIQEMQINAGINSQTRAMKDIFDAREDQLKEILGAFPCQKDQKGLLVFMNGRILGFDVVSLSSAYRFLHEKLVRSYTLDVSPGPANERASKDKAAEFISKIQNCSESRYESVGYGFDYRYESANIVGSALLHKEQVIHTAFFQTENKQSRSRMSGIRQRVAGRYRHDIEF